MKIYILEIICLQVYRHIDNIMFENPIIMDRFLNYWRKTGFQVGVSGRFYHFEAVL